jgi:6,7-dimethyl-8-ribityllumazine synthase
MIVKIDRPTRSTVKPPRGEMRARVLIVEGRFYEEISDQLVAGAVAALEEQGVEYDRLTVPGALEIPQVLAQAVAAGLIPRRAENGKWDGMVALGCVIRGETSHYDIVCNNANHWLMDVAIKHAVPLGNGILTVDTEAQALARARGGADGKGGDAARACLRLVELQRAFEGQSA